MKGKGGKSLVIFKGARAAYRQADARRYCSMLACAAEHSRWLASKLNKLASVEFDALDTVDNLVLKQYIFGDEDNPVDGFESYERPVHARVRTRCRARRGGRAGSAHNRDPLPPATGTAGRADSAWAGCVFALA